MPENRVSAKIMGILNVTPDSFSDGEKYLEPKAALACAKKQIEEGVDIIDIGGVSTGPGSSALDTRLELGRVLPVVEQVSKLGVSISVDTYRASVAREVIKQGAEIINDVSALRADSEMAKVIAKSEAQVVLMYSKEADDNPHVTSSSAPEGDLIEIIASFLEERIDFALKSGIELEKIILDPGMGQFVSPRAEDSWELVERISELCKHFENFPVLLGVSRKGFLGGKLAERDPVSQYLAIEAVRKGVKIIRTHNVKMCKEFFQTAERISGL